MNTLESEIGAFEAKTKLAELLRETERGRSFTICRRGRPVARLVPAESEDQDLSALAQAFREMREKVGEPMDLKALIEEGRRY